MASEIATEAAATEAEGKKKKRNGPISLVDPTISLPEEVREPLRHYLFKNTEMSFRDFALPCIIEECRAKGVIARDLKVDLTKRAAGGGGISKAQLQTALDAGAAATKLAAEMKTELDKVRAEIAALRAAKK